MNIEYTENISAQKWDKIVRNSRNSYFFHTHAWAKILEETYGYRIATRLYEIEGNEALIPMMECKKYGFRYYDSMPLGYGGIFPVSNISSETLKMILNDIVGGRHLLFGLSSPPFSNFSIQGDSNIRQVNSEWNYTHMLPLEKGFDYLWENKFKRDLKRGIKKAEKNNLEIINKTKLEYFEIFYSLYENMSKVWGYKAPPDPRELYENLYRYGHPHVQMRVAVKDDRIIAGLITFEYGDTIFRWMNASLNEYHKYYPNNLLDKEVIVYACEKGFKYYNFGASGNLKGVRKFKESFGAESMNLKKYRVLSRLGKFANMMLRK